MTITSLDNSRPLRLAAVMEAATVTGPAKNLLEFCRLTSASRPEASLPRIEALLFTYVRRGDPPNRFADAVRAAGLRLVVLEEQARFDRAVIGQLQTHLESFAPDVIQSHNPKSHFLFRYGGLDRRWPWVAFHHGYTTPDLKMRLYNQINRWSLRTPRRVITVCQPFVDLLARQGVPRERIRVLHNSVRPPAAIPSSELAALCQQLGLAPPGEGPPLILSVGRFSQEKGQAGLLRAMAHLQHSTARLLLVGDGPDRAALEALAASLALDSSRIIWAGHHPSAQPFYALASVLALPSLSEGSPNVILEAMAAGLPIAATAVGGVPELVRHEQEALLVPARQPAAMAQALDRLLAEPALARRLGDQARIRSAEYTPEQYACSLGALYQEVISAGRQ